MWPILLLRINGVSTWELTAWWERWRSSAVPVLACSFFPSIQSLCGLSVAFWAYCRPRLSWPSHLSARNSPSLPIRSRKNPNPFWTDWFALLLRSSSFSLPPFPALEKLLNELHSAIPRSGSSCMVADGSTSLRRGSLLESRHCQGCYYSGESALAGRLFGTK